MRAGVGIIVSFRRISRRFSRGEAGEMEGEITF